jgi:hypothetical protein
VRRLQCHYLQTLRCIGPKPPSPENTDELAVRSRDGFPSRSGLGVEHAFLPWDLERGPLPPAISAAGSLSMNDLRLIYHWSTVTWSSLDVGEQPETQSILQLKVPELAFRNEFLMHGLLGTASLHMQRSLPNPEQYRKQTDMYRAKAFGGFRQVLNKLDPDSESYEAALMMAVLLVVLCSQDSYADDDDLTIVRWLSLYKGLSTIITIKSYGALVRMSVFAIFRRKITELKSMPVIPTILLNMMRSIHSDDPDYDALEAYCKALDALGELYASLSQDGITGPLFIRVISWCTHVSRDLTPFAREKRPRALIILAYYLAFLKLVPGVWWVEGLSDKEIRAIGRIVGPKWLPFMEVPHSVTRLTDPQEIATLMLR